MITNYFRNYSNFVNSLDFSLHTEIKFRKINDFLGIIEGKIIFEIGVLDILEVIKINDNKIIKKKYKFNFRSLDDNLIFRYDNAPHHQHIASFPHHKHVKSVVIECIEPDIFQIIAEIKTLNKTI